jgi:hypothetical protein
MTKKRRLLLLGAICVIVIAVFVGVFAITAKNKSHKTTKYSAAVLGAKEGFTPLLPAHITIADSSFTNGILVYSATTAKGTRFAISQQKVPANITSDSFRGSRSIPTLFGIAKSTNLNGNTTIGLVTTKGVLVTITSSPAAGNEEVDTLLASMAEASDN